MKKIFLLCVAVSLISCGGDDFTESEVVSLPDVNDPDADVTVDAADLDMSVDTLGDASVLDSEVEVNVPDVNQSDVDVESGECIPGELLCQGKTPVFCNGSGQLQTKPECEYLCVNGVCAGECSPGDERCLDHDVEACDSSGVWQVTSVCPIKCQQNICNATWCCKETTNDNCKCKPYQICNSITGELTSCDGFPSQCCYHSESGSGPECHCLSTSQTYCQQIVDNPEAIGLISAKLVDSCPE